MMNLTRVILLLTAAALVSFSSAVSADRPLRFPDSATFVDFNPCTGVPHTVTIYFDVSLHFHRNNFVAEVKRSGRTDDGYVMVGGHETFVDSFGAGQLKAQFVDTWRGTDDRNVFQVGVIFVLDYETGAVRVEKAAVRCFNG